MKVLVDAISARFGGLATYIEGLAGAWSLTAPEDEFHVVLAKGSPVCITPGPTVRVHRVRVGPPLAVRSPLAQAFTLPRLGRALGADVVLCAIPIVPIRPVPLPISIVVHDLRHELLPGQFSTIQRARRRLAYSAAYARADSTICVSERTRHDLLRLHPSVAADSVTVVPHGADHVDSWYRGSPAGHALAFGHTTNKRPQAVLDTWHELRAGGIRPPHLHVVGLHDQARRAFQAMAARRGLEGQVTAHRFLPEKTFRLLLAGAGLVVFPSDFEGFGLPVLEAMKLGVPVVVGPDAAVAEITAGHAYTAADLGAPALAAAVREALDGTKAQREAARRHADSYTWSRTVHMTRASLAAAITSWNSRSGRPRDGRPQRVVGG